MKTRLRKKTGKRRDGFTLLELLVTVSITAVLSGLLILYNHSGRQQVNMYVSESNLAQEIYHAKSLTVAAYRPSAASSTCGYGVHINYGASTYGLFSYPKPSSGNCESIASIDPVQEQKISSYTLESGVIFDASPAGKSRIDDVLFIPPEPVTLISSQGNILKNGFGVAAVKTKDNSAEVEITVSSAGQITF